MKTKISLLVPVGLVTVWAMMLLATPMTLDLFKDFKVEMPALTMLFIQSAHFLGGLALPLLVLASAVLLSQRQRFGWFFALALCLACDLAFLGLLMPIVSLNNILNGDPSVTARPSFGSSPSYWLASIALLLNQVLFFALVFKRREFGGESGQTRPNQPRPLESGV